MANQTQQSVQDYYSNVLQTKEDLQTNACCTAETLPRYLRPIAAQVHQEVTKRFYGCGSPIPQALEGCTVLDLGCGTGRDCFILSKLVGANGRVIGVDMTDEQLAVANEYRAYHAEQWGYKSSNVEFKKGYIEDLKALDIADQSIDVVVSNCVINLSYDKSKVFAEIFRVLKPGGELYFSDVFASRRIPKPLQEDKVMLGECLGGALYKEDFRRMMATVGCEDARVISAQPITVNNPELEAKIGNIHFDSITVRAIKCELEDRCEDYGQVAIYKGSSPESPHGFLLDDHHFFETGRPMAVCRNTANMLTQTRFAKHFEVVGDTSTHFGLFDCSPSASDNSSNVSSSSAGMCC